jgi:hypothetical protein
MFSTPILIISYNRPDYLKILFKEIKKINPKNIFFFNDGPKNDYDKIKINVIKKIVKFEFNNIKILTRFEKKNLGLKLAVIKGINWFFQKNNEGIILEDDCIPNKSFFYFCEKNLNYHRKNNIVMNIGGLNLLKPLKNYNPSLRLDSYYYNKIPMIWGWATWKRSWKQYDHKMKYWGHVRKSKKILKSWFYDKYSINFFSERLDAVYSGKDPSWAFSWVYTLRRKNGLNIMPRKNLIKNIGINMNTHSTPQYKDHFNLKTYNIGKIVHPKKIIIDNYADELLSRIYLKKTIGQIFFSSIRTLFINKFYSIKNI